MTSISEKNSDYSAQEKKKNIRGFLKVLSVYGLSFAFWLWLFMTNEGTGGVELQHIVIMGIIHVMLVCFHLMALFKPAQKSD